MEFDGYFVHGASLTKAPDRVMYQGEEISADVDTLEVELHPVHGATHGGGSLTLRMRGKNLAAARQEFVTDQTGKIVWVPDGKWHAGKGPTAVVSDGPHADSDQSDGAQRARAGVDGDK